MKTFPLVAVMTLSFLAQSAGLHQVYLLPMSGGLDQYLADWLTRDKVMQVVTDPNAADLVMTDRLGESFEQKLTQIRPPDVAPEKKADDKGDSKTGKGAGAAGSADIPHAFRSSSVRGTIFLVDIKSRQVVWSDHEKPPAVSDSSLNREAERVAKRLMETFGK